ncbi:MAG: class I SAM-dependent methyltransferase [Rhodosalinus sp.]
MLQQTPGPDDFAAEIDRMEAECRRVGADLSQMVAARPWTAPERIRALCQSMTKSLHQGTFLLMNIQRTLAAEKQAATDREGLIETERRWHRVTVAAGQLRRTLNAWPGIQALVMGQAPPERLPLYPEQPADPRHAAQVRMTDDLLALMHSMFNGAPQSDVARDHGCHDDIPMPHSGFLEHIHAAHRVILALGRSGPTRFLDVGCGGGLKVLTATRVFDGADGVEFDPAHAAAARRLLAQAPGLDTRVFEVDALQFDGYAGYDVIYAYRPFRDEEKARRMEALIAESVPPGTVLLLPLAVGPPESCARIEGPLHVAGLSAGEAEEVKAEAERMGCAIRTRARTRSYAPPAWRAVLEASQENGFDLRA